MRRSRRELERSLYGLEAQDRPPAGLITVLTADDVESVPGRPELIRVDGELRRRTANLMEMVGQ